MPAYKWIKEVHKGIVYQVIFKLLITVPCKTFPAKTLNNIPQKFFIHEKVFTIYSTKISSLEINPLYSNNIQWI